MLDLLIGADLVRQRTKNAVHGPSIPVRKCERPRHRAVRSTSAAALRRLAELIEPSGLSELRPQ
jgi:hypothetical protein